MTLEMCVNECWNNKEFLSEYGRLNNTSLSKTRTPIEVLIDDVTGARSDELKQFIKDVDVLIFQPLLEDAFLNRFPLLNQLKEKKCTTKLS